MAYGAAFGVAVDSLTEIGTPDMWMRVALAVDEFYKEKIDKANDVGYRAGCVFEAAMQMKLRREAEKAANEIHCKEVNEAYANGYTDGYANGKDS